MWCYEKKFLKKILTMVWQIHTVYGPNSSENEKVRWSTGTDCPDRIFNNFQLTVRTVNKIDSNTLDSPLFIISVSR